MSTYKLIIQNVLNLGNNFFHSSYVDDQVDNVIRVFFQIFVTNNEMNVQSKFSFFENTLNSFFIKDAKETQEIQETQKKQSKREEFIQYFFKIQKTYHVLNRFIYNYKYKRAKIVVHTDMGLNELNMEDKNVMCIFESQGTSKGTTQGTSQKYLFHIGDLIKIATVALSNSQMFFSHPLAIKNPYNNVPFCKATLYNIYFFIRFKTTIFTELFFDFFRCDFHLSHFKKRN